MTNSTKTDLSQENNNNSTYVLIDKILDYTLENIIDVRMTDYLAIVINIESIGDIRISPIDRQQVTVSINDMWYSTDDQKLVEKARIAFDKETYAKAVLSRLDKPEDPLDNFIKDALQKY